MAGTCLRGVIVLNIGKQVVGMVVDGVSDVISLTADRLGRLTHADPDRSLNN